MGLFRKKASSPPSEDLEQRLQAILGVHRELQTAFSTMRLDWETVTAHVDQLTTKVHRELGHITKRKRDLAKADPCDEEEGGVSNIRRSRFSGGRHS